jgi:hypothetical protein
MQSLVERCCGVTKDAGQAQTNSVAALAPKKKENVGFLDQIEQTLGVDLDGDGDVGESSIASDDSPRTRQLKLIRERRKKEKEKEKPKTWLNALENFTGIDLDGDGDVGDSDDGSSFRSVASSHVEGMATRGVHPVKHKETVKEYLTRLVRRGEDCAVISVRGRAIEITATVNKKLTQFTMSTRVAYDLDGDGDADMKSRVVDMKRIRRVYEGTDHLLTVDLETPVDARCATLELGTGECLTLRFASEDTARLFADTMLAVLAAQE